MGNVTREFVLKRLSELLELPEDDVICVNMEKNILNYSISRCEDPAWENHQFVNIYKHKFLQLQYNLRKSPELKKSILEKKVKTTDVIEMSPEQLWFDGPRAKQVEAKIHNEIRKQALAQ